MRISEAASILGTYGGGRPWPSKWKNSYGGGIDLNLLYYVTEDASLVYTDESGNSYTPE